MQFIQFLKIVQWYKPARMRPSYSKELTKNRLFAPQFVDSLERACISTRTFVTLENVKIKLKLGQKSSMSFQQLKINREPSQ